MNKLRVLMVFLSLPFVGVAQQTVQQELETVKKELTSTKERLDDAEIKLTSLETVVKKQTADIDYLKEALNLRKSVHQLTREGWNISISSVIGDSNSKEIKTKGLITNNKTEGDRLQFASAELVDPKGNQYTTYDFRNKEGSDFYIDTSVTAIPYAFEIVVTGFSELIPVLSLLQIKIHKSVHGQEIYNFKNVDVIWN